MKTLPDRMPNLTPLRIESDKDEKHNTQFSILFKKENCPTCAIFAYFQGPLYSKDGKLPTNSKNFFQVKTGSC